MPFLPGEDMCLAKCRPLRPSFPNAGRAGRGKRNANCSPVVIPSERGLNKYSLLRAVRNVSRNLRNHVVPQARPQERAHTHECEQEPRSNFLFACGARTCHLPKSAVFLGGVDASSCHPKWVADCGLATSGAVQRFLIVILPKHSYIDPAIPAPLSDLGCRPKLRKPRRGVGGVGGKAYKRRRREILFS